MSVFKTRQLVLAIAILSAEYCDAFAQEVVFDSLTSATVGGGFLARQTGASVTLGGTARIVNRIDLLFSSSQTTEPYTVRLETVNDDGFPSGVFWTSPMQFRNGGGAGFNIVTVDVPNVTVSGTVAWVVERFNPTTQLTHRYTTSPPTIGSSIIEFQLVSGGWVKANNSSEATLGTRVYAVVPEPNLCSILTIHSVLAALYFAIRRRRTSI